MCSALIGELVVWLLNRYGCNTKNSNTGISGITIHIKHDDLFVAKTHLRTVAMDRKLCVVYYTNLSSKRIHRTSCLYTIEMFSLATGLSVSFKGDIAVLQSAIAKYLKHYFVTVRFSLNDREKYKYDKKSTLILQIKSMLLTCQLYGKRKFNLKNNNIFCRGVCHAIYEFL